jgi:hypothetical protein
MKKIFLFIVLFVFSLTVVACDIDLSHHDGHDHEGHDHDDHDGLPHHSEDEHELYVFAQSFCSDEYVAEVFVCEEYVKTISSLLGGGATYHQMNGNIISCPVVAPEYISKECIALRDVSCQEICYVE